MKTRKFKDLRNEMLKDPDVRVHFLNQTINEIENTGDLDEKLIILIDSIKAISDSYGSVAKFKKAFAIDLNTSAIHKIFGMVDGKSIAPGFKTIYKLSEPLGLDIFPQSSNRARA